MINFSKKLKMMLSQDKIFEYDPNLSISNGFVRKGVQQSESDFVFKYPSFINSYIEIMFISQVINRVLLINFIKKY